MTPDQIVAAHFRPAFSEARRQARTRLLAIAFASAILGTGCDGAGARGGSATDAAAVAVAACRVAIASQMGLPVAEVQIRDVTRSETGIGVRATVDGVDAPWECVTDPEGMIAAVTFTGVVADN